MINSSIFADMQLSISGPQLPQSLAHHTIVSTKTDLYIIGGYNQNSQPQSIILKLEGSQCIEIQQKLQFPRYGVVAMLIPAQLTTCEKYETQTERNTTLSIP